MEIQTGYCTTRNDLEQRCQRLVSRLSTLTTRLATLVGMDPRAFLQTKAECQQTREDLADSRRQLQDHRTAHRCRQCRVGTGAFRSRSIV